MINNLEPISQSSKEIVTFVTWPSLHSQSSSRLCNTTFCRCCQSWEKFGILRNSLKISNCHLWQSPWVFPRSSLKMRWLVLHLHIWRHQISHNCLVRLGQVWSGWCCTYIYHVIRYLTLFGNIYQCRGPSRKDKDHLHSWVINKKSCTFLHFASYLFAKTYTSCFRTSPS